MKEKSEDRRMTKTEIRSDFKNRVDMVFTQLLHPSPTGKDSDTLVVQPELIEEQSADENEEEALHSEMNADEANYKRYILPIDA